MAIALWLCSLAVGLAVYLLIFIVQDTVDDVRWNRAHHIGSSSDPAENAPQRQ